MFRNRFMMRCEQRNVLQAVVIAAVAAAVWSSAPKAADVAASDDALPEVIVTAQRREERNQDVGVAVTALSGDMLKDLNILNASDITRAVPSLKMNAYSSAAVVFNIRGVSQNDYGDQQEPPVAVYQDDSYSSTIVLASFPLFDLSRVEVLRGPQGTLFGRNATGGAIQFISKQPTPEVEGYSRLTYASFNQTKFEGAVSGPIRETLLIRVAGEFSNGGNYYQAIEPGQHDLGGDHNYALRGILKWIEGDNLSAWITARYLDANHEYSGGVYSHEVTCPNAQLQGVYLPANVACAFYPGSKPGALATGYDNSAINPQRGGDPWKTAYTHPSYVSRQVIGAQLHVDAKFDYFNLTSITDFQHANKFYSEDSDGTPDNASAYYAGTSLKQSSEELRLSGKNGSNEWVAGTMGMVIQGAYDAGFALPFLNYNANPTFAERTVSYALFGQDEWQVASKVKLVAGLRYWDDRRTGFYHGSEPSTGVDVTFGTAGLSYLQNGIPQPLTTNLTAADANKNFSGETARLQIDYKPVDEVLTYLSYNRGSKSGGFEFSAATPFPGTIPQFFNGILYKPETLDSFEAGVKTSFGQTTTFNVAAFSYNYKNYQGFAQYGPIQTIVNLRAKEIGLEAELATKPMRGLLLQLNASTLSSRVKNVLLPDAITIVDHDLPQAPHFSSSALARYEFPLSGGTASLQSDVQQTSRFCFNVLCAPDDHEQGYTVVNAQLGYAIGAFDISGYVNNIANKEYRIYAADNALVAGFDTATFARPRTFGINVGYKFGGKQ
jgi:iron complex outermembrane receptor protein